MGYAKKKAFSTIGAFSKFLKAVRPLFREAMLFPYIRPALSVATRTSPLIATIGKLNIAQILFFVSEKSDGSATAHREAAKSPATRGRLQSVDRFALLAMTTTPYTGFASAGASTMRTS